MGQHDVQIGDLRIGLAAVVALGIRGIFSKAHVPVFALFSVHQHGIQHAHGGHQHRLALNIRVGKSLIVLSQRPVVSHACVFSRFPYQQGKNAILLVTLPIDGQRLERLPAELVISPRVVHQLIAAPLSEAPHRSSAQCLQQHRTNSPFTAGAGEDVACLFRSAEQQRYVVVPGHGLRKLRRKRIHQTKLHQKGLHAAAPIADNLLVEIIHERPAHVLCQCVAVLFSLLEPANQQIQHHGVSLGSLNPEPYSFCWQLQPQRSAERGQFALSHTQIVLGDDDHFCLKRQRGNPGWHGCTTNHHHSKALFAHHLDDLPL